jgi:hypothetical protein
VVEADQHSSSGLKTRVSPMKPVKTGKLMPKASVAVKMSALNWGLCKSSSEVWWKFMSSRC